MPVISAIVMLIILLSAVSCQPTIVPTLPPTLTPPPAVFVTPRQTQTPRHISLPSPSPSPIQPVVTPVVGATNLVAPPHPALALVEANPTSLPGAPTLPPDAFVIGQSAGGRDILAWRFGSGARVLLLVGGIHGGFEANTVTLVRQMVDHFQTTPADVLPGMTLVLIPAANPDGLERGRAGEGRFNDSGVDLNRNWGCEWSAEAYWKNNEVNPGSQPFSEPETRALAAMVGEMRPAAAVFYHSAANGVFMGDCQPGGGVSGTLAAVIGEAAGYPYGEPFTAYKVSGTAPNWLDGQGIPAVDLELTNTRDSEFERNLRGVMAAQRWLAGSP